MNNHLKKPKFFFELFIWLSLISFQYYLSSRPINLTPPLELFLWLNIPLDKLAHFFYFGLIGFCGFRVSSYIFANSTKKAFWSSWLSFNTTSLFGPSISIPEPLEQV